MTPLLPLLTGEGRAHHGEILERIAELVDAGSITPIVDAGRYGLTDVVDAHRSLADATNAGKVVVTIGD